MARLTESDLEKIHGENWPEVKARIDSAPPPPTFWQKLKRLFGLGPKDPQPSR